MLYLAYLPREASDHGTGPHFVIVLPTILPLVGICIRQKAGNGPTPSRQCQVVIEGRVSPPQDFQLF